MLERLPCTKQPRERVQNMMKDNRLLDDLVRVAGGAASLLSSVGEQLGADFRGVRNRASGDESDSQDLRRLQATISKFRLEQESLKKRVAELESALAAILKSAKAKASAAKKSSIKPASPQKDSSTVKKTSKRA